MLTELEIQAMLIEIQYIRSSGLQAIKIDRVREIVKLVENHLKLEKRQHLRLLV